MQTDKNPIQCLTDSLAMHLPEDDAEKVALLIDAALPEDTICIENMPLSGDDIHEYLIFAFSERILIPVRPRVPGSSSWDRILRFAPEEAFFMPAVARILFGAASSTATIDAEHAVREAMSSCPEKCVNESICFLKEMRSHTDSCMAAGELMGTVAQHIGIKSDLSDIIENCLKAGIMNPCSQAGASQRHAWYEFHPCLYWDERFD